MNKVVSFFVKKSPTILTALGACGLISSVASAIYSTPKAIRLLEENPCENRVDVVKTTWKCYIPTIMIMGVSLACIFAANTTSLRRQSAIASLYAVAREGAKVYKDKVVEKLGVNKDEEIRDAICADVVKDNPPTDPKNVIVFGKSSNTCLFRDAWSGQYFRSDMESMRRLQNDLNSEIINNSHMETLNDYYCAIGLYECRFGDIAVFTTDNLIDLKFSAQLYNDEPCIVVDFYNPPVLDL